MGFVVSLYWLCAGNCLVLYSYTLLLSVLFYTSVMQTYSHE